MRGKKKSASKNRGQKKRSTSGEKRNYPQKKRRRRDNFSFLLFPFLSPHQQVKRRKKRSRGKKFLSWGRRFVRRCLIEFVSPFFSTTLSFPSPLLATANPPRQCNKSGQRRYMKGKQANREFAAIIFIYTGKRKKWGNCGRRRGQNSSIFGKKRPKAKVSLAGRAADRNCTVCDTRKSFFTRSYISFSLRFVFEFVYILDSHVSHYFFGEQINFVCQYTICTFSSLLPIAKSKNPSSSFQPEFRTALQQQQQQQLL